MIFAKQNPVGLDARIATIQNKLIEVLCPLWAASSGKSESEILYGYERTYAMTDKESGSRFAAYYKGGKEYENLITAEQNKFFFVAVDDERQYRGSYGYYETDVQLYFILNVAQIYPNVLHRADNEVRKDVADVLKTIANVGMTSIVIDPDRVFDYYGYRTAQFGSNITDNIQPYHYFKVNLNIYGYQLSDIYCANN